MNILYILGNGFDIAQNMRTGYDDFYQYLLKEESGSDLLQKMKQDIKSDIELRRNLWSDMELGFGAFTENVETISELDDLHYEIAEHLQSYLKTQNQAFVPTQSQIEKFEQDFINPEIRIHETDKSVYSKFRRTIDNGVYINVMTLNYTDTLEKLLAIKPTSHKKVFNTSTQVMDICHVHGRLNDTIIWGVDNIEQIKNTYFRTQDDVKPFMVKADCNLAMKSNRHSICERHIKDANLIILFGVSLGDTDMRWWNLIGKELKSRKNIAIIKHVYRPNDVPPDRKYKMKTVEDESKQELLEKMNLLSKDVDGRLFFMINQPMFNA